MTPILDDPKEESTTPDTTMQDAYPVSSPSKPGYRSTDATVEYTDIKLLFKFVSKNHRPDISAIHRQILQAMLQHDGDLVVLDKNESIIPNARLAHESFKDHYQYTNLPRRHFRLFGVGHKIYSSLSLHQMKKNIQDTLNKLQVTLTINHWHTLDVRDVGWLCNAHPFFHHRDHIRDILLKAIRKHLPGQDIPDFHL